MTGTLRRFGALTRADRQAILEATALLVFARAGLFVWRIRTLRRLLDRAARTRRAERATTASGTSEIDRIRWAVGAASRRVPGSTCLVAALTADVMLRRRGLESALQLGVSPTRLAGDRLDAHAWVESGGAVVVGDVEALSTYARLSPLAQTGDAALCAVIRGEDVGWQRIGATPADVLRVCSQHDLTGVILGALRSRPDQSWPAEVVNLLKNAFRSQAAVEALRGRELADVLETLAANGIHPILFKGAALAYDVYDAPASRPRNDVDLMIRGEDVAAVRRVMGRIGYTAPPYCDGELIFCQFELAKQDAFGVDHAFDFHWKISTQVLFADALSYDDLVKASVPLPALGPHARTAGQVHALLLACIHPAMHHRNEERLLWLYDVHLLVSRLTSAELERFAALALDRRVATVCADQLQRARARFGTDAAGALDALSSPQAPEPSAEYLTGERRWRHELLASMRGLPRWRDRLRLAREVLLPSPRYMLASYGVPGGGTSTAILPALYVHRALSGAWKILLGRK